MAVDPFSWAQQYSANQEANARQENSDAQNDLMSVFRAEAARQQPWSDLPVDLAKTNALYGNKLDNSLALASQKAQMKPAPAPAAIAAKIRKTAIAYGVDPDMAMSFVSVESQFNPNARSPTGAMGLFQIIPSTAQELGIHNPYDVDQNIDGGIRYMKQMQDRLVAAGKTPDVVNTYLLHQQGPGGGMSLLNGGSAPANNLRVNNIRVNADPNTQIAQITAKVKRDYDQRLALRSRGSQQTASLGPDQKLVLNGLNEIGTGNVK